MNGRTTGIDLENVTGVSRRGARARHGGGLARTAAIGRTGHEIKSNASIAPYFVAAIALLVMATVLAGVLGHLGPGQVTVRNGIVSALFVWLGFVATTLAVNHAFQGSRRSLTLIDGGHWLGVLLIQGTIIGGMGV